MTSNRSQRNSVRGRPGRPPAQALISLGILMVIALALAACSGSSEPASGVDVGAPDGGRATDTPVDAAPDPVDTGGVTDARSQPDERGVDDGSDGGAEDATSSCQPRYAGLPAPTGPLPGPVSEERGISAAERPAYEQLRDSVLADPGVRFVATFDHDRDAFVVEAGADDDREALVFRRNLLLAGGVEYEILEGTVDAIFGSTDPRHAGSWEELLGLLENPNEVDLETLGYAPDDPRVGFLDLRAAPLALRRLASLFDAPDAPDMVGGLHPWAHTAPSTHGGIGLLQSRSVLFVSGAGARRGVVLDDVATVPDVAPTVLAALGAPTTGGVGPDGTHDDGLHLLRQDGRVLVEALATDACDRPKHVIVILFDGLMANELNHLALDDEPEVDLPTFRALAADGAVYRHGAVTNFPSVSAPGHMSSGCGLWSGHHGIIANAFYRREDGEVINPFVLLQDISDTLAHPEKALEIYERGVADGTETLAQAAHRAFGAWDPATGEGAYVAVLNEIAVGGADYTTVDFLRGGPSAPGSQAADLQRYDLADNVAVIQVETLLDGESQPVPTILQLSLVKTDAAGEAAGPHSELLRSVLVETDGRVARILEAYARRDALDATMVVLVSDHGMELQDPSRSSAFATRVRESGVEVIQPAPGIIYFPDSE